MDKKGQNTSMQFLLSFGLGLLVFGLAMTFGAQINEDVKDDLTVNSSEYNVSNYTTQGLLNASKKQGTLGTIGVAVVIIGLLVTGFGAFQRR